MEFGYVIGFFAFRYNNFLSMLP